MTDVHDQVKHLEAVWSLLFPAVEAPTAATSTGWLCRYEPSFIRLVLARLQKRYLKRPWDFPNASNLHKFCSTMLRTQAETQQHTEPNTGRTPREENLTHV